MENDNLQTAFKAGAYATLIGAICMLAGAALWGSTGADLDKALDTGELANYLTIANENMTPLIANISLWIFGVILIGIGATMMTIVSKQRPVIAKIAQYNYWIAVPIAVVSYVAWLAVIVRISAHSTETSAAIAEAVGWFASRADWIATILIVGTGPALIASAGKNDWVPNWLRICSFITLFAGLLTLLAMYAGRLTTYGFLIIPVGIAWLIAASIVMFKQAKLHSNNINVVVP